MLGAGALERVHIEFAHALHESSFRGRLALVRHSRPFDGRSAKAIAALAGVEIVILRPRA